MARKNSSEIKFGKGILWNSCSDQFRESIYFSIQLEFTIKIERPALFFNPFLYRTSRLILETTPSAVVPRKMGLPVR